MIFISYAREDRERVGAIIRTLQLDLGIKVWSDSQIQIGTSFTSAIEDALADARVVIVFWTRDSVKSQYVREEARIGLDAGKLLPVRLEDVRPPVGFVEVQGLDLFDPPPTAPSDRAPAWNVFFNEITSRLSPYVKHLLTLQLDVQQGNELDLARYFTREGALAVVWGRRAEMAVLPFFWGLAMLGFKPEAASEPAEMSGEHVVPILKAIETADLVLFALYPPKMSQPFFDLVYQRAGAKAQFVVFGSLTPEEASREYGLAHVAEQRFLQKRAVGFPLIGEAARRETWATICFISDRLEELRVKSPAVRKSAPK